jgi:DNA-binding NarL/FixJ family response regulator
MSQPIRLLIVHEDTLHRQCLATALAGSARFQILDSAADPAQTLLRIRQEVPDVVLVDWDLPNKAALCLTRHITHDFPEVKALLLAVTETPENIRDCAEAGAAGYVLKGETLEQLTVRIDQAMRGETVCSASAVRLLFARLAEFARQQPGDAQRDAPCPTSREMQILQLIADGMSNKEIASRLCLSLHTVKNHVHNLLEKLSAEGRYAAVRYAYERRWLKK